MRLLHLEHDSEGGAILKVSVLGTEDLWHLYNFIVVGDMVKTKTVRKVVKETATGSGSSERKVLKLTVLINTIDFDPNGELRLSGVNKTESDWVKMNQHHTLSIRCDGSPQEVTILKSSWDSMLDERIKEACNQEEKADTVAVVMDATGSLGHASVCLITPTLMVTRQKIECHIPKKHRSGSTRDDAINKFFAQVLDGLLANTNFELVKVVLICSPGTVREEFYNYAMREAQKADTAGPMRTLLLNKSKLLCVKVSSGHKSAIQEALGDRLVSQRMDQTKCAEDVKTWQAFHDMMNTDPSRCCYTEQFVFEANKHCAIDSLLILDEMLRVPDVKKRTFYTNLCQACKDNGAKVNVFSSQHVTGEQLKQLAGIAAILRHPMPELDELDVDPQFFDSVEVEEMLRVHSTTSANSQ